MIKVCFFFCLFLVLPSCAQIELIKIPKPKNSKYSYSQVEPSIYINPNDTSEVIAGSVLDDYYYSKDGGRTWNAKTMHSEAGVYGDPCMLIDTAGNYYYFHLSQGKGGTWLDKMICQKASSIDGEFNGGTYTKENGKVHDKEWAVVNQQTNDIYMTWTQFDKYDSKDPKDSSFILFSKSTDQAETWSLPKRISKNGGDCKDDDQTAEGAVPAVGPNGEIYTCWSRNDSLWLNKSIDGGETWMKEEKMISSHIGGWTMDINGINRCNGMPITHCDISPSKYNGRLYVNFADKRNGEFNSDIFLIYSDDQGETWTEPIKVNQDDSRKEQFFTWMSIDQTTGYLYFVYYDRRNHKDRSTDLYCTISRDGGQTFSDLKVSDTPFKPNSTVFFGDYTNIHAHQGMVRPIWTRLDNYTISLWTAILYEKDFK